MTKSRTAVRRVERERERSRRRLVTIGVLVISVIALLAVLFLSASTPADAPLPETAARYDEVSQNRTIDNLPRLGEPSAPVLVSVFCSFDSPECRTFHDGAMDALVERVRDEKIALTYIPLPGVEGNARGAALASLCAAEQNAFWRVADMFYLWQGQFDVAQAFSNNRIISGVQALELNYGNFDSCVRSNRPNEVLTNASQNANALASVGLKTVPAVTINGALVVDNDEVQISDVETILARIDAAVESLQRDREPAAEATPEADEVVVTEEAEPEATAEATTVATEEATPEATAEATEAPATEEPEAESTPEAEATESAE